MIKQNFNNTQWQSGRLSWGGAEAGESLLSSEQQKAIKTNRPTTWSDFPSVCLQGGGRQVKGFQGIIFSAETTQRSQGSAEGV